MKLIDIADILFGFNYQKEDIDGATQLTVPFLQAKDIQDNLLNHDTVFKINAEKIDKRHVLKNNDILFAAKGNRNFAFHYNGEFNEAVASSTFFIIRIKIPDLLPEYLSWYLNSKSAQTFFKENAQATFIPSISKSRFSELDVPIPGIEIQKNIIRLDKWNKTEKALLEQISAKRTLLVNEIINQSINQ